MAISLEEVDVARMSEKTGLCEDQIRGAFNVYSPNDRALLAQLESTSDFDTMRNLFIHSDPDTAYVKHQLAQAMLNLALSRDQLWKVLNCVVSDDRITEQALTRLLNANGERSNLEESDLKEIATTTTNFDLADRAISRLAEYYKRQ